MKHFLILCLALIVFYQTTAQTFTHSSSIPTVSKNGFYRIEITPDLGSYLKTDYSNLRLLDHQNQETPFLIDKEARIYSSQLFSEYAILEKKQTKGCTSLIVKNADKKPINNISIQIKNAEVTKEATLLGSDDQKQWYALKQNFTFHSINNHFETSEIKILDFPLSNYLFYKLQISDSTTAPINILKVGFYNVQTESGKYSEVPGLQFSSVDSVKEKSTYVHFTFDKPRFVDKIDIEITGVPFYKRSAFVYEPKFRNGKKVKKEKYNELIEVVELSSTHATTLSFSNTKVKDLLLVIDNDDNQSLTIQSAKAYQLNRYITTWLKKDEAYTLKFAKNLSTPTYDIGFFRDSIPANTSILHADIVKLVSLNTKTIDDKTFFTTSIIIWIAIILVIIILGVMSVRMIKETSK